MKRRPPPPVQILPQQAREHQEPEEGANPMPRFVIGLTALLLAFGAIYIARTSLTGEPSWGDGRTQAELQGPDPAHAGAPVDGAAVYAARCTACHQASGAGVPGVFPPLAGSEWVTGSTSTLAALVLHGINGPLTVKGTRYNGAMPAFAAQLPDAELAAVLTHVRRQWGNAAPAVSADMVATARRQHTARTTPFNGDAELAALK